MIATMLGLGMVVMLLPGAIHLRDVIDEAQREMAQEEEDRLWCIRNPMYTGEPCARLRSNLSVCWTDRPTGTVHCRLVASPKGPARPTIGP